MGFIPAVANDPTCKHSRVTLIEDVPQTNLSPLLNRTKLEIPSFPRHSDFHNGPTITPASDQTSDASSMWSHRSSQSSYDSLYDATEGESEEVPIKLSASVKRHTQETRERSRYPSLVIPSPSKWPTIQKLQSPCIIGLSPASRIAINPANLETYKTLLARSPAPSSGPPSLDGSQTSEELSLQSCPSTPELQSSSGSSDSEWDQPLQLDPFAFEVLHHLQSKFDVDGDNPSEPVITDLDEAVQEMQEIVKESPIRHDFALSTIQPLAPPPLDGEETISALTVPSPGGFFSSLDPHAAQTWGRKTPEPSTSIAENFYGVPWRAGTPPDIPPPSLRLMIPTSKDTNPTGENDAVPVDSPVPALCLVMSPSESSDITEITQTTRSIDYTASYERALTMAGLEHSDRTKLWLHAQAAYLSRLWKEDDLTNLATIRDAVQPSPDDYSVSGSESDSTVESGSCPTIGPSPATDASSPSKKSVKFAKGLDQILSKISVDKAFDKEIEILDPVFYHALRHVARLSRNRDAFIQSQARAEFVHVERCNIPVNHCKQITGNYEISTPMRPAPVRPISSMLPNTPDDDDRRMLIATAERERQALEQIKPSAWSLQAEKMLRGGKLLNSPVERTLCVLPEAKILDYGGQSAGDWAWQVALEYRNATVYTLPVPSNDKSSPNDNKGPNNHHVLTSSTPWALPFPDETFDIISARTLQVFLRAAIPNPSPQSPLSPQPLEEDDEWDLVLTELYRVLKPGGYLEYTIYDASILRPGPLGLALSVEFAFNLRTRGYDPCACQTFLPRLRKAGFEMIRRGWIVLPMADVQPRWTDAGKTERLTSNPAPAPAPAHGPAPTSASAPPPLKIAGDRTSETNFFQVEKSIGPDGLVEMFQPPLTGSTAAVRAMTGLVGARAWEQWMLKLGAEMGRRDEDTVRQVARVLEEGGKEESGWKCLMGWARK